VRERRRHSSGAGSGEAPAKGGSGRGGPAGESGEGRRGGSREGRKVVVKKKPRP
jgi:hypothetical protein